MFAKNKKMESPFKYGKIAENEYFTNRENEIKQLVFNFLSLVNTILISPRRWGKSSLVAKAAKAAILKDKGLKICFLDLFNIRNEGQFYEEFAKEILKNTSTSADIILENAKKFLKRLMPKISFSPDSNNEISLSFDWNEANKNPDDILNLPENIAKEKKIKLVVCIDEFQNISEFEDALAFQKKLRANWQKHQNVSYCLYGSKRHMLIDVFTSTSMPFYKFGEIIFLQKIKEVHWLPFLQKRFSETGKVLDISAAKIIVQNAECHPYYVQQLAQQSWFRTTNICDDEIVNEAFEELVMQLSLLFQTATDNLSNTQINFLNALLHKEPQLSSKEVLIKYNLGTSANVLRIKQALTNKEIIDIQSGIIEFIDPLFKHWLKNYYFII